MGMKDVLKKSLKSYWIYKERKNEENIILRDISPEKRTPLTEKEKREVNALWSPILTKYVPRCGKGISYKELEVFKYMNGFDPRYIGHNLYLPLVARRLNDYHYTKFYEDKGIVDSFSKTLKFPKCLCRCINGEFYDDAFRQISKASAIEKIVRKGDGGRVGGVIFKISRGSSGGHGVYMLDSSGDENFKQTVVKTIGVLGKDYIAQEVICQHEIMAKFNPSSVNTFRITTLYLNGRVSLCAVILRIGKSGAIVDNMCLGGTGVGVDESGCLHDYGYDYSCSKISEMNGVRFAGIKFEFVPAMIEMVMKAHKEDFPMCKFIGWDVCVDQKGNFIVIEINSSQPEIIVTQLNNGPIFKDRTEEVIEYIKDKDFKYNRGVLNY